MKILGIGALIITGLYSLPVSAQCGTGVNTGGQCIPPEVLYPSNGDNTTLRPQHSNVVWSKTWGAIAGDSKLKVIGTSVGLLSKSKAKDAALAACASRGGHDCKIEIVYHNQCLAAVMGEDNSVVYGTGPSKESAAQATITEFSEGEKTKTVYSECTEPVRIR